MQDFSYHHYYGYFGDRGKGLERWDSLAPLSGTWRKRGQQCLLQILREGWGGFGGFEVQGSGHIAITTMGSLHGDKVRGSRAVDMYWE